MRPFPEIPPERLAHEVRSANHPLLVWFIPDAQPKNERLPLKLLELASELSGEVNLGATAIRQDPEWVRRFPFSASPTLALFQHGTPIAMFDLDSPLSVLSACLQGLLAEYADPVGQKPQLAPPPPKAQRLADRLPLIGLIGGMSWESSLEYYRLLNEAVKERLGGLHSARCVLYSVDFAEVADLQRTGRWADAARLLIEAAQSLERAGANIVLLCTNTMHKVADSIQSALQIPLLHIADATALRIQQAGLKRVGLLGTRFTMEDDFYRGRLDTHFHLEVMLPAPGDRDLIHRIIYEELCLGQIREDSRSALRRIIDGLASQGAEAIILGCTELGLLLGRQDAVPPVFDTTREHALQAVDFALGKGDAR